MDTGLTNRTALITGGGTGIGAAIAQGMAAEGANVIVNYSRSEQDAQNTVAQITDAGGQAIAIRCDVSQSSQVRSMFEQARGHFGQVDILVNNAGRVFSRQPTADLPEDMWDQTIDVNLKGVFLCSQAAIAQMPDKIGRIINITSVTAFSGVGSSSYGAAKGGVNALTRCMALELGSRGITVNALPLVSLTRASTASARHPIDTHNSWKRFHWAGMAKSMTWWVSHCCWHPTQEATSRETSFMSMEPCSCIDGLCDSEHVFISQQVSETFHK